MVVKFPESQKFLAQKEMKAKVDGKQTKQPNNHQTQSLSPLFSTSGDNGDPRY